MLPRSNYCPIPLAHMMLPHQQDEELTRFDKFCLNMAILYGNYSTGNARSQHIIVIYRPVNQKKSALFRFVGGMAEKGEEYAIVHTPRIQGYLVLVTGFSGDLLKVINGRICIISCTRTRTGRAGAVAALAEKNRGAEARGELLNMYSWFTEGRDTPLPRDARALLQSLS